MKLKNLSLFVTLAQVGFKANGWSATFSKEVVPVPVKTDASTLTES